MEYRVWNENADLLALCNTHKEALAEKAKWEKAVVAKHGAVRGVLSKYGINIQVIDDNGDDITDQL